MTLGLAAMAGDPVGAQGDWEGLGVSEGDWEGARAHLDPGYVQEWPQSGERIVGAEDALAIDRNFPGGLPAMTFRRTVASGDLAVRSALARTFTTLFSLLSRSKNYPPPRTKPT